MTTPSSFRRFKWDCSKIGCFNKVRRLDFGPLFDCFPGKISMSDIDGIVETNGHVLMLESKYEKTPLAAGQRIMFERLSRLYSIPTFVIVGGGESMEITHMSEFWNGKQTPWVEADLGYLRGRLRAFSEYARQHPNLPVAGRSVLTKEDLRDWRMQRGLTQERLAAMLGEAWRTVENWERGAHIPLWLPLALRGLELEAGSPLLQEV